MSGRWADRPLAPRCSTKAPQIPYGLRLLFSIWATLRCRPTPAPAVRLKLYSSDGPDPARAPRTGSIQGNFLHRGGHLAADRGRLTRYPEVGRSWIDPHLTPYRILPLLPSDCRRVERTQRRLSRRADQPTSPPPPPPPSTPPY